MPQWTYEKPLRVATGFSYVSSVFHFVTLYHCLLIIFGDIFFCKLLGRWFFIDFGFDFFFCTARS
jgi:hypothetical protein